jgi:branched-chain amino acid transport system substrate-binding protein
MIRRRWFSRGAVAGCAVLLSALAPAAAPSQSAEPIVIPVVISLTGQGAFLGKQQAEALAALESSVNARGGVKGRKIHFDIADDQTSPQVAVQLTDALLTKKPAAIIGSDLVGPCAAMSALTKSTTVQYCTSPGLHPEVGSFTYSVGVSTFDIIADAIRYYRRHGEKKIALLTSTDATGQDIDHAVDAAMKSPDNHDVEIVAHEHFATSDLSVAAQLARIKAAQPDVVFGEATGPPFGTILQAVQDAQLKVPVFTSTGNMVHAQLAQYGHFGVKDIMFVGVPS